MRCARAVVCSVLLLVCGCQGVGYKFPEWFKFGAASSAYQVEGGWNASDYMDLFLMPTMPDDKEESIWDHLVLTQPWLVKDGSNGSVACDSYHLWRRDIEMVAEMGLDMYRFSISWPRLLPSGYPNHISEDGKKYYNDLIDGLLEKGIEPVVTLYHFDLPQSLQDLGGWANPLIAEWFTDYADVVFSLYADRVKTWVTINEPIGICDGGYGQLSAPFIYDPTVGRYLCNKNILIAHAKAYRLYDEVYRPKFKELNGKLSLATLFHWFEPETPEDAALTELSLEYWEGRFAHPVFSDKGGWPTKLETYLNKKAKREGYLYPRLPPFSPEEIELVKGTYDYYGLNHYTTRLIRKLKKGEQAGLWPFYGSNELRMKMVSHRSWRQSDIDWFAIYPEGLRKQLSWLQTKYNVKEIIILESGVMTQDKGLEDTIRVEYIRDYLEQVLLAISDGVPVTGYTAWTMMDNFEWLGGYSMTFGLYAVDFTSPNRTRTKRDSATYYSSIAKTGNLYTKNNDIVLVL